MPDDSARTHGPATALPVTTPNPVADNVPPPTPLAFLWHYLAHGFLGYGLAMVALLSLNSGIEASQPVVLGQLVNALSGHSLWFENPAVWFAFLVAVWMFNYLSVHAYNSFTAYTQVVMRVRIHDDLFGYLHGHAPRYFLDHASGALAAKVRATASATSALLEYLCSNIIRLIVMFGITTVLILRQAPQLLGAFALFVVVFSTVATVMALRMRHFATASANASAAQTARLVDSVANWEAVRGFARADFEREGLKPYSVAEMDTQVEMRMVLATRRISLHVLSVSFLAWLVWNAFSATRSGVMTVGAFTTVVTLAILVATHIRGLGDGLFNFFEQYGVLNDGLNTLLAPHEITDPPGAVPLRVNKGGIVIRDLTFGYSDGTNVFEHFSLSIRPGERVGLVGPSGAGKSTLIKLLRRQFLFHQGQILVDGQDITHVTWDSLHDVFAEVPQNPGMFHRSVADNIRYSRPDATDAEVIAAARDAHCHDFIANRPKGYQSVVGEKGMKLSGGERQRVAIARAFLKNAPILILDEATSSLDSEAEHLIQDGLLRLMEGRTVIAIAHRLSTIMHLDRIVVLEDGKVVEDGDHATLLARGGTYARLWNHQAGGFIGT